MAFAFLFTYIALFSTLSSICYCFNPRLFNNSKVDNFGNGRASWYGIPTGAGSDGGACGYQNAVDIPPFSSRITAAADSLFNSGKGCGVCYQVKCTSKFCSGKPVTVVVTDECPGCDSRGLTFDLSGTSFGAMAYPGQEAQLRNVGLQQIQWQRVDCRYPGVTVAFRVDPGSNGYYFAVGIEYENGDGLTGVDLKDGSGVWRSMQISFGAVWKVNVPSGLKPPFSIRLNALGGRNVVAYNVIPYNYKLNQIYRSLVNF